MLLLIGHVFKIGKSIFSLLGSGKYEKFCFDSLNGFVFKQMIAGLHFSFIVIGRF